MDSTPGRFVFIYLHNNIYLFKLDMYFMAKWSFQILQVSRVVAISIFPMKLIETKAFLGKSIHQIF